MSATADKPRVPARYLGPVDVAHYMGVHPKTVRNWIEAGQLPARRINRKYFIDRKDLNSFVQNHGMTPAEGGDA